MKNKSVILIVFLLLTASCHGIAQNNKQTKPSYYSYIQEIHNGPVVWHKDISNPYDLGVMYRAVIIKQEAYYGLIVELFRVSDEGGLTFLKNEFVNFEETSNAKMKFKSWTTPQIIRIENEKKVYEIRITKEGIIKSISEE